MEQQNNVSQGPSQNVSARRKETFLALWIQMTRFRQLTEKALPSFARLVFSRKMGTTWRCRAGGSASTVCMSHLSEICDVLQLAPSGILIGERGQAGDHPVDEDRLPPHVPP